MAPRDQYAECNTDGAPPDVFAEECCKRCFNSDCSRAMFAQGPFEQRTLSWEDRLFNNVPRMPSSDPRFLTFSHQAFTDVPLTRKTGIVVPSSWEDPRDLAAAAAKRVEQAPEPTPQPSNPVVREPEAAPPLVAPVPARPTTQASGPVRKLGTQGPMNTPLVGPRMLDGSTPPPVKPPEDPWAVKGPEKDPWSTPPAPAGQSDERVVSRGAKIRLNGP